jgi:hypothetical protein
MTEERARQAEIDAARARELEEERAERMEMQRGPNFAELAQLQEVYDHIAPKIVRNYIRSTLLGPALQRLYDIGMGVATFDTPVGEGRVLELEAPPNVQTAALKALVQTALPTNHTLDVEQPNVLPGVIALGPLDLDDARRVAHGERYLGEVPAPVEGAHPALAPDAPRMTGDPDAPPPPPMEERVAAGEFEIVEVDENPESLTGATKHEPGAEDRPPLGPELAKVLEVPATPIAAKAREILEKRRARRATKPKARHLNLTDDAGSSD